MLAKLQDDTEVQELYEKVKKNMHDVHAPEESVPSPTEGKPVAIAGEGQSKEEVRPMPGDSRNSFEARLAAPLVSPTKLDESKSSAIDSKSLATGKKSISNLSFIKKNLTKLQISNIKQSHQTSSIGRSPTIGLSAKSKKEQYTGESDERFKELWENI